MTSTLLDRLLPLPRPAALAGGLLAAALLAPAASAQDHQGIVIPADQVRRAVVAVDGSEPDAVDDVRVSEMELKRALVYTFGTTELEARKIDVYIEEEIRRQMAAGAAEGEFAVSEEEIEAAVQETLDSIAEQYPDLEAETVLGYNNIAFDSLGRMTAQSKLFEKVFLPEDPAEWPETTREAIRAQAGEEFITKLEEGFEERKRLEAEQGVDPAQAAAGKGIFNMLMRNMVMGALNNSSVVETASDGLPPHLAMRVNGVEVPTEEIYGRIADNITDVDRQRAEAWVTKTALLEAVLKARGAYLSDEEFAAAYEEHGQPYEGSPLSLEVIVRNFKGFPSMEAYKTYYRLLESYKRSIAETLTDETLTAHLPRANRLLGVGSVDLEVILCSAFDFSTKSWRENGWEKAAQEAREVARKLVEADGENWSELLAEHSDFWDPPAPKNPTQQQQVPQKKKNSGRFGTLNRNELLGYLEESDYSHFVDGYSVADSIFFDLEPGQVGGPWKGRYGYYFARVKRRVPPTRTQTLADENFRTMVTDDYVTVQFNAFARAAEEAARGL